MLPIYKLLSLLLRVTSRPLINLTKRYHANNRLQNDWVRRQFYKLGTWFHTFQTRMNRHYLKMDLHNIIIKPLSESNAIDKGIQFFYELIFYSIALGFPIYEIYRHLVDSKAKDKKLISRVQKVGDKIQKIKQEVEKLRLDSQQSQWQVRYFSFEIFSKFLLFCNSPTHSQLSCCIQFLRKQSKQISGSKITLNNNNLFLLI